MPRPAVAHGLSVLLLLLLDISSRVAVPSLGGKCVVEFQCWENKLCRTVCMSTCDIHTYICI